MFPALQAAKAKFDSAAEDLKALGNDLGNFKKGNPYRVEVEFERRTGWHVAYARIIEEPKPAFSVRVGLVAYELLSALHLIAWELAARKVGSNKVLKIKREIEFPITKDPSDFESRQIIRNRRISKQAIAVFRELQPYRGGYGPAGAAQHPLVLLKELADADKHRVLAASFAYVHMRGVAWTWDEAVARNPTAEPLVPPTRSGRVIEDGAPVARIRFEVGNAKAKVNMDPQPAVEIVFNSDNWTLNERNLWDCVATTGRAISKLTPLFPRQREFWPT